MYLLQIAALLVGAFSLWTIGSLVQNYRVARRINLPIVISPTATMNPLWIICYKIICPPLTSILTRFPIIGRWPRCTYYGWQYDDNHLIHDELGPLFTLVTPGANEVIVADPTIAHHILHRRKDFRKPSVIYDGLNIFGKNLDSVEGETWQRHRKITAPNFNERVSSSVWAESTRQARQILKHWKRGNDGNNDNGTRDVVDDTAALALNVLTHSGFGLTYEFDDSKGGKLEPPHKMSYRDALYHVLRNFAMVAIFPLGFWKIPFLPNKIKAIGEACDEFRLYMQETVDREQASVAAATVSTKSTEETSSNDEHNLLRALIRASKVEATRPGGGLTDDELYGNLFIYNLAGHETTANTIATAIAYLAANPKWQDWLHTEIARVLPHHDDDDDDNKNNDSTTTATLPKSSYESTYPNLPRCQATMLETLRLHGSIICLPKATSSSQTFNLSGTTHIIPADTFVVINSHAIHTDPKIWGDDALTWRPDRWITTTTTTTNNTTTSNTKSSDPTNSDNTNNEALIEPTPGTFLAWADGPRNCPGRKFSQVEFAGVVTTLFRDHRVRARPEKERGEDENEVRARLSRVIEDSTISAITLQMKRPRDVALVWESRSRSRSRS